MLFSPAMTRDEAIIELAIRVKLLSPAQIEEAKKLQALLAQNGLTLAMTDILEKKEFLTPEQVRLLQAGVVQEENRAEDQSLVQSLIKNGILTEEIVREARSTQDFLFQEGRPPLPLTEILLQKGRLLPEQLQRARQQIENARPAPSESSKKLPAGLTVEGCRIAVRKTAFKDGAGTTRTVCLLDIEGALDAHTFKPFDDFVHALIDDGRFNLALNCEKLEYLSSAGIGVLANAVKRCREGQGDLCLYSVQDKVQRIINLVGLQSMLRLYDSERAALVSFRYA